MPFDFNDYQKKCDRMTKEQLHAEWDNYTRQISGGATSTATSVLLSPLTAGVSLVGLGISAPRIHNARKKREIIEAGLQARGTVHHTRVRDVVAPMAITGAISGLTLGIAGLGADVVGAAAVQHGVEIVATQAALEATASVAEKTYEAHSKKKDLKEQENFGQQVGQDQIWMNNPPPSYMPGPLNTRPGLHTSQTWPQNPQQEFEDFEKGGYMATPSVSDDFGLSTPTSSLADIYDQITFQLQQSSIGSPNDPQPGVQASHTWPQNSEGGPKTDAEIQALGADRAKLARAQNKLDRKAAQKRKSSNSLASFQSSPDPQYLSASPVASPDSAAPQKLSRSLSVRSIMIDNGNGNPPSALTVDEEILFLRGRLLQLEIKKRGEEAQIYGADQIQVQQTTQVQFLVQDEIDTPESLETQSYLSTAPQNLNQPTQEQTAPLPLRRHSPSAPVPPTNLLDIQSSTSLSQDAQNYQHPPQPVSTHLKRNSIPRKKVGSAGKVSSLSHEVQHSAPAAQALPVVAEDSVPNVAPAEQQYYPPSFDLQQKPPPKERQDSGYYSLNSTSSAPSPDQTTFGLPQTPEFLSFTPQAFGLPPTMSSRTIEEPQFDSRSPLPPMSPEVAQHKSEPQYSIPRKPPMPSERDSQSSIPRRSSIQSEDASQFSVLRKTSEATSQAKRNSQISVASVPQVVEHRNSQSSIHSASPPPPYLPPPTKSASIPVEKKDYFAQMVDAAPAQLKTMKARARKSMLDIQGWQWGK